MRTPALFLTLLAATLLAASARGQDKSVDELRKERLAVLKDLTEILPRLFQVGHAEVGEVIEAREQLLHAELDAAQTSSDRVALYKKLIEELKQYEQIAQARKQAAKGTEAAILQVKSRRLAAEIQLKQTEAKQPDAKQAETKQSQTIQPEVKSPAGERRKVVVTRPMVNDVVVTQQYTAQINSHRRIDIRSLENGYLDEIPVKEGQAVKQGDLLCKIVPTLHRAKLDAELAEARLAELEYKDAEKLAKEKVISPNELARQQAKLDKAQAKAKVAATEFSFADIRAPFDGIIGRLQKQKGSLVTEQDTVTTLFDNRVMWVYFNVPQQSYLQYSVKSADEKDDKLELLLANGDKFDQTGKLGAIDAKFNEETGNIAFRADFPNPDGLLRHGMVGSVLIHRTVKDAVVIPQRATFEILDKRYVYVVGKDNLVRRSEITVLHELPNDFVIDQEFGADDRLILEGVREVQVGQKVEAEFRSPEKLRKEQKDDRR